MTMLLQRFPLPEVLKPNVAFWKKIYAQYSSNQVLIHDAEDLDIIYEVVDFRNLFSNPDDVSERTKWKRIERIKKRYKRKLYNIADKLQRRQSLTEEERRIVTLFGDRATPFRLRKAARNLRGQRGMKEKFHEGLRRSGLYFDYISEIFKRHNLPQELIMLPHVESSFNYKAYSKYGAAGIWQFTRSTGRLFYENWLRRGRTPGPDSLDRGCGQIAETQLSGIAVVAAGDYRLQSRSVWHEARQAQVRR
ncbi:MAG: transglycosylase SLT domain-containing protein [candidate division KSB1 bacterium]|nr:transglycosylase SLT domain-containing protein [candidate division KSB1 bacterium]